MDKIDITVPKYEYHLLTWGGFYNEEYFKLHGLMQGDYWFDTAEERRKFIEQRREIEAQLGAYHLVISETEGYCCRIRTVLHRVIESQGRCYYSSYDLGVNFPFSAAKYHLEYKWNPGFNDYPLGEDFDYDENPPAIIKEWITGAYQDTYDI